ncbi:phosphocarrier protein HPr [Endomicrobiia bacterium]|uniref:HPr family phosphocarrier protein n=1 Tax=Endomicrobium trichonymphae TaxID=1408204 RepID=UPI00086517C8|nr:HPr family phosphocarrier protein [Candidatus Endomicrobium trichonymphae]BAV59001.1 phosphocarrier protein HPr [Candidatus Endomicrobium trichonymphae]GHT24302.1 phosphocarrier protein HPr [Endomicrobiia bacterium]
MKEKIIVVLNKMGLHARPAAMLVQIINEYHSSVKILKDGFEVDAKSIMGVMTLTAGQGSKLNFVADGLDENEVLSAIENLFKSKFGE